MSILSGFKKFKRYIKTGSGYQLTSEWTSASTVEMADGNTAETNLGSIKGITNSLASTSSNYALSAKAGKDLKDTCDTLNDNLSTYIKSIPITISGITCKPNTNTFFDLKYAIPNGYEHLATLGVNTSDSRLNFTGLNKNILAIGNVSSISIPADVTVTVLLKRTL